MKKTKKPVRKYLRTSGGNLLKYNPICLWCGKPFVAARPDAKSCTPACRRALHRYVKANGQPPLFPFGLYFDTRGKNQGA